MPSPGPATGSLTGAAPAVRAEGLRFGYDGAAVLEIPTLEIAAGERVFIHGPSGSGKSTLLSLLAGVLAAGGGRLEVLGRDLAAMSGAERDRFRGAEIGYIFQMFNLIPYLSVLDNIGLPCRLSAARRARLAGRAIEDAGREMAERLGIAALLDRPVARLSVGQQQRVAAARALIGAPGLILADEPTSALDTEHREAFLELLFERCQAAGSSLVFVSHDRGLRPLFDRALGLDALNRAGG